MNFHYPRQGDHVGEGICSDCGKRCEVIVYDDSFDHAFGTEHQYHYGSDCCDAEAVECYEE